MTVENISIDVKTNAGQAASQFRSLSSALSGVRNAGRSVASGGTHKAISRIGQAAKTSTGFMGKLLSSIKRIAFYRLLRTIMKNITQAFQEGLKHVYAFSKAVGGDLAQALDSLASASGQMKNQMGAALGELLQTIMPIIQAIIAAINALMAALSALFAALGGRMTYSVADKTADSWDKAAGSAKEYKNTVLGFDELNKLNDETGGGGGGGADAGAFEEVGLPDWAEKIRLAIEDGDWFEAGKALAEHLNELIDSWDAYEAGRKLGEKINHVIEFAFGFLKNFNFGNLGKKVAEFFNGIFDTVNWDMLGRTLVRAITGVFDFLIGFIENIDTGSIGRAISDFIIGAFDEATQWLNEHDWEQFGKTITDKINDFITNIDWGGIGATISGFFTKAFLSIKNFFKGGEWKKVGENLSSAAHDLITNINWKRLAETLSGAITEMFNSAAELISGVDWGQLGEDVYFTLKTTLENIDFAAIAKSVFSLLGQALVAAIQFVWPFIRETGIAIYDYFMQFIVIDQNDNWLEIGLEIIGGILEGVAQALVDVFTWIMENVVHPIIKAFCDAFGIHSPSTVMRDEIGDPVGSGILEGILQPFKDIYNWLKTNIVDPLVDNVKSLFGIDGDSSSVFSTIGSNIINGLLSGFQTAWTSITTFFETQWSLLKGWWEGLSLKAPKMETPDYANVTLTTSGFASGGEINNDGTLFVAGEAGAEVVANLGSKTGVMNVDQMEAAVANGNIGVINAIYGMANMIVKAVDSIDMDVTLDGESLADKMYRYNQNASNRYGMAMVT